jgi:hypothetical protein
MLSTSLILALLALPDAPHTAARTTRLVDLATLTASDADALNGKLVRVKLTLDSLPDTEDGCTLYDAVTADQTARSVWFASGQEIDEKAVFLTVEGTLGVVGHPRTVGEQRTVFPAFVEFRLVRARIVP